MRLAATIIMIALAFISQAAAQNASPKADTKADTKAEPKAAPKRQPAAKSDAKPDAKADTTAAAKSKSGKASKKAAKSEAAPAQAPAATPAQREAYAAMPVAERLAIQSDLIWTGDLTGAVDPEFGDRAIAAVRSFQRRNKLDETGILVPDQRRALAAATRGRKEYVGWQLVEDSVTPGVRLGVPGKLVPQAELGATGSRWSSARGEIQIETFREKMAGATLNELFEEMKRKPSSRRVESHSINGNSFALSGLQGLKKFHVRAYLKDNEARGLVILYDQAMEGIMLPMVDTIANSYLPFGDPAASSIARKVEYGSGIVVSRNGHIVTERQLTENCHGIIVAGLGRADRLAEDKAADLALLRVNGAGNLTPLTFSAEPPKSTDLTLVGIADPGAQAGARNVTTANARLRGVNGSRVMLEGNPPRGFAGGAALDGQGQFAGMIDVGSAASFIPTATIRKFLDGAGVYPATARGDVDAAKNAIVRVICVRK